MNYALRGMSLLETSSLQCGHTGLPYLYMYIHAGVATETFASASDTSQSTYGIEHIEVKDMHLYILCRCVVLPKTRLMDIAISKKGYYMVYNMTYANTAIILCNYKEVQICYHHARWCISPLMVMDGEVAIPSVLATVQVKLSSTRLARVSLMVSIFS